MRERDGETQARSWSNRAFAPLLIRGTIRDRLASQGAIQGDIPMNLRFASKHASALALGLLLAAGSAGAQQPPPAPAPQATADAAKGAFLLTIFLKHDESKTLDQINAQLRAQGYYKAFPPPWASARWSRCACPRSGCARSTARSSRPPGAATVPSSIRPTITRRSPRICTPRRNRSNPAPGWATSPRPVKSSLPASSATPAFARAAGLPTRRSPRARRIAREAGKA